VLDRQFLCLRVNGSQGRLLLEQHLRDVVRERFRHRLGDDQQVGDRDDRHVSGQLVGSRRDDRPVIQRVAVAALQFRQHVVERHDAGGDPLRVDQVENRRGRQAAIPEERVDLAVFQRVHRLRDPEVVGADVLRRVEAGGGENPLGQHGRPCARRTGGHDLASQISDRCDPAVRKRDEVRVTRIEDGQHARRDRTGFLERVAAGGRVGGDVGH